MYIPANGFFFLKIRQRWYHPDHVHTIYTIQHFLHAMYFRCYNNYMIEENDINYKVMFFSSHLMFYCSLFFKITKLNVFFFLRNSVLCIWLSNEGI